MIVMIMMIMMRMTRIMMMMMMMMMTMMMMMMMMMMITMVMRRRKTTKQRRSHMKTFHVESQQENPKFVAQSPRSKIYIQNAKRAPRPTSRLFDFTTCCKLQFHQFQPCRILGPLLLVTNRGSQ